MLPPRQSPWGQSWQGLRVVFVSCHLLTGSVSLRSLQHFYILSDQGGREGPGWAAKARYGRSEQKYRQLLEILEYPTFRLIIGRRNRKCLCEMIDTSEHLWDDPNDRDARITATACSGKTRQREGERDGGRAVSVKGSPTCHKYWRFG